MANPHDMGLTIIQAIQDAGRDSDPALQQEHKENLRAMVRKRGEFKEPIEVCDWPDGSLILDGHTRYEIWLEEPEETKVKKPRLRLVHGIKTVEDAEKYALEQALLARRNLRRESMKHKMVRLLELGGSVADVVTLTGSSRATVYREVAFLKLPQDVRDDIESGAIYIPRGELPGLLRLGTWAAAVENCRAGRAWNDDGKEPESPAEEDVSFDTTEEDEVVEPVKTPGLSKNAQEIQRKCRTMIKNVIPVLQETSIEVARMIHSGTVPKRGGFPVELVSSATAQIMAAFHTWEPVGECPDCETGCSTCNGRGWKRRGSGR